MKYIIIKQNDVVVAKEVYTGDLSEVISNMDAKVAADATISYEDASEENFDNATVDADARVTYLAD